MTRLVPEGDKNLLEQERKTRKGIRVILTLDNQERHVRDFGGIWDLAGNAGALRLT